MVSQGAEEEGEEGGGEDLVPGPAQDTQVGGGEGGEDGGSVRDGPVEALLVLEEDQPVPVDEEDKSCPQAGSQVLAQEVVRDLPPGDLPHGGQGEGEGGVEVTSRHSGAEDHAQEHSHRPPPDPGQ